jgi:histidinol-phosphate aminotransferase
VTDVSDVDPAVIRRGLDALVPYEPGRPIEDVQRELGLERVVKLASNEGPFGPFPLALEAIQRTLHDQNRYPDGGCHRLRVALAERHGVSTAEIIVCAGADAVIGYLCQATLDPGDEVVTPWPSFISYVLDPLKEGAVPVRVPLRQHVVDPDALLEAITSRTKLVFIATPNNPTGTMTGREALDRYFARVPDHVLTVVDQAYFEYIDDADYPDAVEEYAKQGHAVVVLRTFSKIYGLAGMRIGYGVGPASVLTAAGKVRRAFDVSSAGQAAALASLGDDAELARRRSVNREAMARLAASLRANGLDPVGPALGNFLFVDVGEGALRLSGVIVRPLGGFGAPTALRITAGTVEEIAFFDAQLADAVAAPA